MAKAMAQKYLSSAEDQYFPLSCAELKQKILLEYHTYMTPEGSGRFGLGFQHFCNKHTESWYACKQC